MELVYDGLDRYFWLRTWFRYQLAAGYEIMKKYNLLSTGCEIC